jgi:hypothetical protein
MKGVRHTSKVFLDRECVDSDPDCCTENRYSQVEGAAVSLVSHLLTLSPLSACKNTVIGVYIEARLSLR